MTNVALALPGLAGPASTVNQPTSLQLFNFPQELFGSVLIVISLWLVYLFTRTWINYHFVDLKERHTWRTRAFYVVLLLSIYFIGRIWIDDPQHIVTFLGIIAAALTLTQKETIMNLVGCVLIYWRDLFSTGDRVQIMSYYGDVTAMGLFYFNLMECDPKFSGDQNTGKIVRIPNGLVITNPVTNFSGALPYVWNEFKAIVSADSDYEKASYLLKQIIDQQVHTYYEQAKACLEQYNKNNFVADQDLFTQSFIAVRPQDPSGIEITIRYLCYPSQHSKLESIIWAQFLKEISNDHQIKLAFG